MIRILLTGFFRTIATSAYCQLYKWTDKDGKVHYSDQVPPQDAKQRPPLKAPPAPANSGAASGKFRAEEELALGWLCAIAFTEFGCALELNRLCTLDEMVKGGPGGKPKGFEKDPRNDPNYQYSVNIRGSDLTLAANPRKPGLAGFFNDGNGLYYSASGAASVGDKRVQGGVNCQGFSK